MFRTAILARRPTGRARGGLGALVTTAVVTTLGLATPGVAGAVTAATGTGDLVYAGCIGDRAGCTATAPAGALDGASALAVTPSGSDLYAASSSDVSHFRIDTAGNLIFAGCIGDLAGCTPVTASALNGADAVTITGANLYVAAAADDVSHFLIGPAGDLTYAGCIGNLTGCTPITANALDGADGLAVTPAGTDLYASSWSGNVVNHFRIDPAGNLIFAGCIGNLTGCTPITAGALAGAQGVVVTPGGKDLYAAAFTGKVLDHFRIDTAGNLIYAGCIGDLAGCTPTVPKTALDGATGVAVNPAGTVLYATSRQGNVVSRLRIDPAGNLIFESCTGDHSRCAHTTPAAALDGAYGIAVTRTSGALQAYVSSAFAAVVSHFRIGSAGKLIFAGCTGALAGCTPITANALDGAAGLATSGGTHLYAAAFTGDAVSHFAIARFSARAAAPPLRWAARPVMQVAHPGAPWPPPWLPQS